jgi:hypothetical protein
VLSVLVVDPTGDRLASVIRDLRDMRLAMPLDVVAVIGGPDPARLAEAQREFPLVTMKGVFGQTGLGALLSAGAELTTGRYVLVLDGTARVGAGAIEGMMQFLDKGQWVGAVGPRLLTPDGSERASSLSFPTVQTVLDAVCGAAPESAAAPAPRIQYALNRQVTTPKEVEAIAFGCCMVRKKAITEVGAWDALFAPGGEALDWCKRAKARGWSVFYHPGVAAQLVADERPDPAAIAGQLANAQRYIRKHAGRRALVTMKLLLGAVSLRAMVLSGCAALVPGTHRAGARFGFWRAWHAMGALLAPRRAAA